MFDFDFPTENTTEAWTRFRDRAVVERDRGMMSQKVVDLAERMLVWLANPVGPDPIAAHLKAAS